MADRTTREMILGKVHDLAVDFLVYDRQDDEDLPIGAIERSIKAGAATLDEIVQQFRDHLREILEE